jgi:hypothetical protein
MADGGGFLQGLHDWLLGTDATTTPGTTTSGTDADTGLATDSDATTTPPSYTPATQGVLSQLGHYLVSPEGRLAIGTTLRAGTGDPTAFQDQARIQQGWAAQAENARKQVAQTALNQRYQAAIAADPTGGQQFRQMMLAGVGQNGTPVKDISDIIAAAQTPAEKTAMIGDTMIGFGADNKSPHIIATAAPKPVKIGQNETILTPPGANGPTLYGPNGQPLPGAAPAAQAAPPAGVTPPAAAANIDPAVKARFAQMIVREAGGEGPAGMLDVGNVALNQVKQGFHGYASLASALNPHEFTGLQNTAPLTPQEQAMVGPLVDQLLSGQAPDRTNGATQYLNPVLQAQNGAAMPDWTKGRVGQRLGNHVFYGGGQQAAAAAGAGTPASATAPGQTAQQAQLTAAIPPVRVASAADAAKLPPNRQFITPDGRTMWSKGSTITGQTAAPPAAAAGAATPAAATTGAQPGIPTLVTPAIAAAEGIDPKYIGWTITKGQGKDKATGAGVADAALPEWKGLTGQALLDKMAPSEANQVQALAEGRLAYPTGRAADLPVWRQRMAGLALYDPSFDFADPQSRVRTRLAFTGTGKGAQQLTAANNLMDHLSRLDASSQALGNVQGFPMAQQVNQGMQALANNTQTQGRYARFGSDQQAVAEELTKFLRGGTGAVADVKGWMSKFGETAGYDSNHAAVKEIVGLMSDQLANIAKQYQSGMGRSAQGLSMMSPENIAKFKALGGKMPAILDTTLPQSTGLQMAGAQ